MDSWNDPAAFDDLPPGETIAPGGYVKTQPKLTQSRRFELISFCMAKPMVNDKRLIDAFLLTFIDVETGEEAKSYFRIDHFTKEKTGRKLAFIKPESDLAKLHRLATGEYKPNRYRKANGIPKDLIGLVFEASKVKYAQHGKHSETSRQEMYLKISSSDIKPLTINQSELWTNTGALKGRGAGIPKPKKRNKNGTQTEQKRNENGTQKNAQTTINTLPQAMNESEVRGLRERGLIEPLVSPINKEIREQSFQITNELGGYDFERKPGETLDQFNDRVLDATF
ncbi:hypothetical protein [Thiomicrospira cyclica]|uniref:Uncharacterized protein n=1 Tax=Thiomicrospira cyclica (strain DSM 14477 / JCM 11371 / ALM1) TaxID=717773 RepID=F6DCF6_THICA|nr:hypothetical protein [Thiomicrospira cyclica]AEG31542.1 hypothetical protein Thicy_0770 [Thiomicrospira cyclica ALM1]